MAPTAANVLDAFHELPPDQQRAVRAALWPRKAHAGPEARRAFADARYAKVHDLIVSQKLPTKGRHAWAKILSRLHAAAPHLCYRVPVPEGQSIDMVSAFWHAKHFMKARNLRGGYLAWLRRNAVDVNHGRSEGAFPDGTPSAAVDGPA
jgi:hypothetical protein